MSCNFTASGNAGTITLNGDLTLATAAEFRALLIKALIDTDTITISFENTGAVDLSCVQLLCSAHRSAVRMGKQLVLTGAWPGPFRQIVNDAGFIRNAGCRLGSEKNCLWIVR